MSHSIDETYDIYNEQTLRARKPHRCCACDDTIPPGHRYCRVFVLFDGRKESFKRCARCQTIHEHLRDLGDGEMWPDERLNCGEEYRDHWGVEPPEHIAALAFVEPTEMQQVRRQLEFRRSARKRFSRVVWLQRYDTVIQRGAYDWLP
jgi:hypothetical protein